MALLEVRHVRKVYKPRLVGVGVTALRDVSFSVRRGEFVAIMGESGSGKTTLLNILAALDKPTSGQVLLGGTDLARARERDLASFRREHLGFVFQDFNLLDALTVRDNIFLPLVLANVPYAEMERRLVPLVRVLGIERLVDQYPYELSGGQKQRTAIARALITHPFMLLADEPTGALDSRASESLLRTLERMHARGQTILMVTHSANAASRATRVLFLKDGKVSRQMRRGEHTSEEFSAALSRMLSAAVGPASGKRLPRKPLVPSKRCPLVRSRLSFPWLAMRSIRLNARFYLPYLLSRALIVALHYDIQFLNMNTGMDLLPGASSVHGLLSVVVLAVDFFSIFLFFYTNSFLMKRRQRELGLYSILGMERRHLRKLLRWETAFVGVVAIGGGLLLGIGLSQLFVTLFRAVMQMDVPLRFEVPRLAILYTMFVYGLMVLIDLVTNLVRVSFVRPIVLFRATDVGDSEPRIRWFVTAIGVTALALGYFISFFTNPLENLGLFLLAVLLVILATYCLFSSASIAILKRLRANASYYYQPRHFFAVANMLHRMRRNATGLATICVLSTMALVTASTTFCLYVGADMGAIQGGEQEGRALVCAYFFVGLFLSVLFLTTCVLIVYYKQVSEGYEDAPCFAIMQQVGMSNDEVDLVVRGQNSLAFLPPLVVAAFHTLAALPITNRILLAFGITNLGLVVCCTALTLLVYGVLYLFAFDVASRVYRGIIAWSATNDTRP